MPSCPRAQLPWTCTASFVLEMLTFVAAPRPHTWLKILCVWAGNAQVQLGLQHPLSHPLALFTCGRAAGRPGRPVGVDAGLWSIICRAIKWEQISQPAALKRCFGSCVWNGEDREKSHQSQTFLFLLLGDICYDVIHIIGHNVALFPLWKTLSHLVLHFILSIAES